MFAMIGARMVLQTQRHGTDFYYWYGLGLALVATGLLGVMLQTERGSVVGWTGRLTQYIGGVYLLVAALTAARDSKPINLTLATLDETIRAFYFTPTTRRQRIWLSYLTAVAIIALASGARVMLERELGPGLASFAVFYPAIMVVALSAGFGPALVALILADVVLAYNFLAPHDLHILDSPIERMSMLLFNGTILFICALVEINHRLRQKAAAYDREAAEHENQARLATFAEATFEGIVESEEDDHRLQRAAC